MRRALLRFRRMVPVVVFIVSAAAAIWALAMLARWVLTGIGNDHSERPEGAACHPQIEAHG